MGLTDLHSHLVPAVDDGARSVGDSLEGVGRLVEAGFGTLATTPHVNGSLTLDPAGFEPFMEGMDQGWATLREAVAREYPEVELQRGHEVMLDVPKPDLSDPRLHLGDTEWVLVEWPRLQVPPGTGRVLRWLKDQGVRPLIAHPERYHGVGRELEVLREWTESGAVLQVNLGSLAGRYGDGARTLAFRLLRRGWVGCLSTDFHARPHLKLYVDEARELLEDVGASEQWDLLIRTNPARILQGEEPVPVPEIEPRDRFWNRLKAAFGLGDR